MKTNARVIAFYLPQFHPIPENDKYWGRGFTEWTNVAKAKPLFKGHNQPRIPADLGFYDLRLPQVRKAQAEMAREAGIEGFCYWHYWFGDGKELLEMPFKEVVKTGEPDFPFCLGWANHNWSTKTWTSSGKITNEMIAEMKYPGEKDYILHFNTYLQAFKDDRYIRVDGKLLFLVYAPLDIPDNREWMQKWQELAKENGLNGFFFVGLTQNFSLVNNTSFKYYSPSEIDLQAPKFYKRIFDLGYDAVNSRGQIRAQVLAESFFVYYAKRLIQKLGIHAKLKIDYRKIIKYYYAPSDKDEYVFPTLIPNFDRTPRAGWNTNALWFNSTPELFRIHLQEAISLIKEKKADHKIIFLQSWNEWGEGNYVEPDLTYGHQYLDILKEELVQK